MKYLALILILLGIFFGVKAMKDHDRVVNERKAKEAVAPLEITLSTDKRFLIGAAITVQVIYKNESIAPIQVSTLFTTDASLIFEAADLNGLAVDVRPSGAGPVAADSANLKTLQPGETMAGSVDLNKYFKFADATTYQIMAVYHGLGEPGPRSNAVRVELDWPK